MFRLRLVAQYKCSLTNLTYGDEVMNIDSVGVCFVLNESWFRWLYQKETNKLLCTLVFTVLFISSSEVDSRSQNSSNKAQSRACASLFIV